jgi:type II secretory pathway pseudopilin PulG
MRTATIFSTPDLIGRPEPGRYDARSRSEQGMALITVILVMMLCSVLMVGFVTAIVADNRASGLDRDQTQAYAVAHAGLEQLTSDLSTLFTTDFSPSRAQVDALAATPPSLPGFQYLAPDGTSGYRVGPALGYNAQNSPIADPDGTISAGPYQGFRGIITPYDITVTARSQGGAEVRMRRQLQTVAVPVFQFGMFSEGDLSFFAGPNFNFGGRVHTNGNLWLAQGNGNTLTLADRVTAVGEVIRTHLSNGQDINVTPHQGTVNVIKTLPNTFRALAPTEGSLKTNLGSQLNEPKWTSLSIGTYVSNIRNGRTGARALNLPLVSQGAPPVTLVRRPALNSNEHVANRLVYEQRYFGQASLRILLSDTAADILNLPTVTNTAPVALTVGAGYAPGVDPLRSPLATSGGPVCGVLPNNTYRTPAETPLLSGFIKIEQRTGSALTAWNDVTGEILGLGITGRNLAESDGAGGAARLNNPPEGAADTCGTPAPNSIVRLQRVRDAPNNMGACGFTSVGAVVTGVSADPHDYWPNALYDSREGYFRDANVPANTLFLGGIMHYVELDVNNLRRWILGQIGASGPATRNDNGYIIYFSDRRNNRNAAGNETGEYGFEDVITPGDANGTPNGGLPDTAEDVNASGALDVYGATPQNVVAASLAPFDAAARPWTAIVNTPLWARANRSVHFRRALKIVNGAQGQIIAPGMTVAAENPVYLQGNFNAQANNTLADPHVATAIVADAVTMLSNSWNDINSFTSPLDPNGRRVTGPTGYRVAIVSGKGLSFPRPAAGNPAQDFGTDGGAHNFLRYLENWTDAGGVQQPLNYRGSIVSFFTSRQAVGTYKCCAYVYGPPIRAYNFDNDFLVPTLLPPGTPMFRDINTLTFRQLLRPTQ